MNDKIPMTSLFGKESYGSYGVFKLDISVGGTRLPDLKCEAIRFACYEAEKLIETAVMSEIVKADPDTQERARAERAQLLGLFNSPIFVEEIPNGYSNDWYNVLSPWFVVTTNVGKITIGWRRRVISINWEGTRGTKTADELFKDEDVTKGLKDIHAWGYEKAQQYVDKIISTAVR